MNPFLNRPEGFSELGFRPELARWFQNRDIGVENFTDNTELFRDTYRELFLQRTRQMLRDATPDLNLYAKRVAEWLQVEFSPSTEEARFSKFSLNLKIAYLFPLPIPFAISRKMLNNEAFLPTSGDFSCNGLNLVCMLYKGRSNALVRASGS